MLRKNLNTREYSAHTAVRNAQEKSQYSGIFTTFLPVSVGCIDGGGIKNVGDGKFDNLRFFSPRLENFGKAFSIFCKKMCF